MSMPFQRITFVAGTVAAAFAGGSLTVAATDASAQPNNSSQCTQSGPDGSAIHCSRQGHDGISATPPEVSPPFNGMPVGGS
ncbi:hypothetical protein GCM10009645_53970 [Mycolicibacterium poriferae]|uniref:Intersectin-EH binding protein Ibp1 n=2 Tax=Mycolicibacterium poriferae TaxID=39694 RepID=A0A6N4VG79_9MYCO|nr:hypothetical protein MPOR_41790 [Mycolicibacterium poriferae]